MRVIKKKTHTLIANPKRVIRKYRLRLLYRLHKILPPIYNEDYDLHWNHLSFKNKKILDLGADYGSTASYFLCERAKQVIAVEGNHDLASKLEANFSGDDRVIPVEQMIKDHVDIASLINHYTPDIIKVDIEGSEVHLLKCRDEALKAVKEWLIEAHSPELCKKLIQRFLQLGFKVFKIRYHDLWVIVTKGFRKA